MSGTQRDVHSTERKTDRHAEEHQLFIHRDPAQPITTSLSCLPVNGEESCVMHAHHACTPCLKQESPADARVTRDSAVIPIWPSAAILDFMEPVIQSAEPNNPYLEPNMEWIGCTVSEIFAFKLHCDIGVGTAGATGALAPAMLKPRGRKYLLAPAIICQVYLLVDSHSLYESLFI